jgi:hypothetical protein
MLSEKDLGKCIRLRQQEHSQAKSIPEPKNFSEIFRAEISCETSASSLSKVTE